MFSMLLLSILSTSLHSQVEKRIRRDDLTVRVRATLSKVRDDYLRFQYVFENDVRSHQSMSIAVVELNDEWEEYGGSVRNLTPPVEKDWGQYPDVGEKMRWRAQYDTTGLDILELVPRSAILPGERLSFSFETKGLPGIGSYWAEGWAPWFFTQEEEDSLIAEGYNWEKSRAIDENFFKGTTIVRRSPSAVFNPTVFLDTLLSYTRQSVVLGWLKTTRDDDCDDDEQPNDGVPKNIEKRIEKAKKELLQGDSVKARKELEKLVKKVEKIYKKSEEAEKKKRESEITMSSEAYALLKYNTEYLIERLSGKKEEKEKKGGEE